MNDLNKSAIGQRIKDIRVSRRETLELFAQAIRLETKNTIKTTKSNVSKWEKGLNVPNDITLQAIANLGNTTVDYLIMGDPEERMLQFFSHYSNVERFIAEGVINKFINENKLYPSKKEVIDDYNKFGKVINEIRRKNWLEQDLALNIDQARSSLDNIAKSRLDDKTTQLLNSAISSIDVAEQNYEELFKTSIEDIKNKYN